MRIIQIIALNTFREIIRDRILYGLIVFTLLLIGLSLALGQLSFTEQARISANFGLTAIHLSAVILSVFVGSTLVAKEIDKQTILTLLVRPISRLQFLLGKCSGLLLVIFTVILGLSLVQLIVLTGLGVPITESFFVALFGISLESLVLLGVTILFSTFSRPLLVVCFAIGFFLIGHWVDNLNYFADVSRSEGFRVFAHVVTNLFPNLERFNWRSLIVYNESVAAIEVGMSSLYAIAWFVLLVGIASLVIRKKDFG